MTDKKAKKKRTVKKKTTTPKPKLETTPKPVAATTPKPKPTPAVLHTCVNCKWWNNFGTDELGTCQNTQSHWHTVNRKSGKSCVMWEKKVV